MPSDPFDLHALLDELGTSFSGPADRTCVRLASRTSGPVPQHVCGDSTSLRNLLVSLLGRTIQTSAQSEVTLEAALLAESEESALIRFTVSDSPEESLWRRARSVPWDSHRSAGSPFGIVEAGSEQGATSSFWFTLRLEKRSA